MSLGALRGYNIPGCNLFLASQTVDAALKMIFACSRCPSLYTSSWQRLNTDFFFFFFDIIDRLSFLHTCGNCDPYKKSTRENK